MEEKESVLENKEVFATPDKKEVLNVLKEYLKDLKGKYSEELNKEDSLGDKTFRLKKKIDDAMLLRSFIFGGGNVKKLSLDEAHDFKVKVEKIRDDVRSDVDESGKTKKRVENYEILENALTNVRSKLREIGDLDEIASIYANATKENLAGAIKVNEEDLAKMEEQFKEISHLNPKYEINWKREMRESIDDSKSFNELLKKELKNKND